MSRRQVIVLRARAELSAQRAKNCGCSGTSARLLYSRASAWLSMASTRTLAPLLAPQPHRLLARAVREGEEHALACRLDLEREPRRHDEDVARLVVEGLRADRDLALALDDRVHGAVGGAIGSRGERLRHELDERGDGRHGVAAGQRIDELHLPAVT